MNVESLVTLPSLRQRLEELTGKPALSYARLWQLAQSGKIPSYRLEGRFLVDPVAAAEALAKIPPARGKRRKIAQ